MQGSELTDYTRLRALRKPSAVRNTNLFLKHYIYKDMYKAISCLKSACSLQTRICTVDLAVSNVDMT